MMTTIEYVTVDGNTIATHASKRSDNDGCTQSLDTMQTLYNQVRPLRVTSFWLSRQELPGDGALRIYGGDVRKSRSSSLFSRSRWSRWRRSWRPPSCH